MKMRSLKTEKLVCFAVIFLLSVVLLSKYSNNAISAERKEQIVLAIIIADSPLDKTLTEKIINQNKDMTECAKVVTYRGPVNVFLKDPYDMTMAMLARYDGENNSKYLEQKHVTVSGKVASTEYIMIKILGSEKALPKSATKKKD